MSTTDKGVQSPVSSEQEYYPQPVKRQSNYYQRQEAVDNADVFTQV